MSNKTCIAPMAATSNGVWQHNDPINFSFPLLVIQISLVLAVTRTLAYFFKPLRQPRVIAEIIVSPLSRSFSPSPCTELNFYNFMSAYNCSCLDQEQVFQFCGLFFVWSSVDFLFTCQAISSVHTLFRAEIGDLQVGQFDHWTSCSN